MSKPYRIVIENEYGKYSVESPNSDITIEQYIDLLRSISLAAGWSPNQVESIFNEQ